MKRNIPTFDEFLKVNENDSFMYDDVAETLDDHEQWMSSRHRYGKQAIFNNRDFKQYKKSFIGRNLSGMIFNNCNLSTVDMSRCSGNVTMKGCEFENANLSNVNFKGATFESCSFGGTNMSRAKILKSKFLDVEFVGVKFSNTDFSYSKFEGCDLGFGNQYQNVNLNNCVIENSSFYGISSAEATRLYRSATFMDNKFDDSDPEDFW